MYARLKHIHRACWDLPVTNNRGVKCEVCICHVSVLSSCEVAVNEESRWRTDITRWSRRTSPKTPVPKLPTPSLSIPVISASHCSSALSQQSAEPPKMNRTAKSNLTRWHTHTHTCRPHTTGTDKILSINFIILYLWSKKIIKNQTKRSYWTWQRIQ